MWQALFVVGVIMLAMFPALVPAVVVPLPTVPVLTLISAAVGNGRLCVHKRRPLIHTRRRRVHDRGRFDDDACPHFIHRNLLHRTAAILLGEIVPGTGPNCCHARCREIPGLCTAVIERRGRNTPDDLSTANRGSTSRGQSWWCAMAGRKRLSLWRCWSGDAERLPQACQKARRPMPAILGRDVAGFTNSPCGHPRCSSAAGRSRAMAR